MDENFDIPEKDFINYEETVHNLESFGIDGELVISDNEKYIMTEDAYFDLNEHWSVKIINDYVFIENEDGDKLQFSREDYKVIEPLLVG